jgi:unsaturated rhamnogalacturonyl hydrolase
MKHVSTLIIAGFFCTSAVCWGQDRILVSVKRDYAIPARENAKIVLDWRKLQILLPTLTSKKVSIIDQHFGKVITTMELSTDVGGQLMFEFDFTSNEPVWVFKVTADGNGNTIKPSNNILPDKKFVISYLKPVDPNTRNVADKIIQSTINAYPDPSKLSIISPGKWTYEYGFFLNAMSRSPDAKSKRYFDYMKAWVDNFVTPSGEWKPGVYDQTEYKLDDILPGRLCIWLYQQTKDGRYKKVADQLLDQLKSQPKTKDGGYWHKQIYPYQMWLDGIYMGDVFSMQYAAAFNQPQWYDEGVHQIKLMYQHAYDPATGLLFHGWDESINKVWADPQTGTSPERWARAVGWYAMALVECLDYLPASHRQRKNIEKIFSDLCRSIVKYQDERTKLWFQVMDKGSSAGNWIETSSSAMFVYALAKGAHNKLIDKGYLNSAEAAYRSLMKNHVYQDEKGDLHLDQAVKVGTLNIKNSKGDYDYYIGGERRLDDYKGLAAWLYASLELKK